MNTTRYTARLAMHPKPYFMVIKNQFFQKNYVLQLMLTEDRVQAFKNSLKRIQKLVKNT